MKEDKDYKDWYEFATRVYSKNALEIFANEVTRKDYGLSSDEVERFAAVFRVLSDSFKISPQLECYILQVHLYGISIADNHYQFYYYLWAKNDHKNELYRRSDLMEASFYAESFILRWFSYFEKLSNIINWPLGYPLDTEYTGDPRVLCSFKRICNLIENNISKNNTLLHYLADIANKETYNNISALRHDLTHRYLTLHSFAGSSIYGAIVKRAEEGKTITLSLGPKKAEKQEERIYTPEEVYSIIDEGTDLLVEIKNKVLGFASEVK